MQVTEISHFKFANRLKSKQINLKKMTSNSSSAKLQRQYCVEKNYWQFSVSITAFLLEINKN